MAATRTLVIALATVGVLALGGCAAGPDTTDAATDREAVRAITLAESQSGGRAFELEGDDGEWEVHVATDGRETEVRVSADGGEVRSSRQGDTLDGDDQARLDAAVTTLADAVRIAAARTPGGARIERVELDEESGTTVWEVSPGGGTTVRVSASDGAVL
ncbi:PepSY domain-containing protein [uncultured Microbacterium sp.]|uniref:PepSY domain-containing protein n=1 Tax=uncultured Microbacterium sp. TaxID=191216 RepID=UPI0025D68117|nr:PepSY domain-containing protein [uncultured Microbacterium sp.]